MSVILIDEIFNVLNLIARIVIAVFIVRRFVVGKVKTEIEIEKQQVHLLEQQHVQIKSNCSQIAQKMKDEEKKFEELQRKFDTWNQEIARQTQHHMMMCQEREKNIERAHVLKQQYLQKKQLTRQEVPAILEQTTKILSKKFESDKDLGKKYRTNVIELLQE